jgi:imidazolonepropionase-like amidohydrolase
MRAPVFLLLLSTLAGCASTPPPGSVAIRCGTLIDGIADAPRTDVTVEMVDGRIVAVGPRAGARPAADQVDLGEYTCLPGLIDLHTHLTMVPDDSLDYTVYYKRSPAEQTRTFRENARATLTAGFTSVRDLGAYIAWTDRQLRDDINAGVTPGPRMQVAGFFLTIPGGGGDLNVPGVPASEVPAEGHTGVARGPEEFRRKAELAVAGGADVLKVIASGAVFGFGGEPGDPEMTQQEIAAVVAVAHRAGLKVAAHAHGARSIRDAILAGVDTIEHASLIDDAGIELARQRQVPLVMDVYNGDYTETEGRAKGYPAEFLRKNLETTEAQRLNFTKAHAALAPIAFGTDACIYPHGYNARQFAIMVQRGMSPMEAIKSATSVAAGVMGWSDRVGSVAPGQYGDLIAVKGNPLDDIRRLEDVAVVVKGGKVVKSP